MSKSTAFQTTNTAIRERDEHRCANCAADESEAVLDVHHIVPRGRGGSNLMSNQVVLCRQCHDACHGEGMAPTVQTMSTGQMDRKTFELYRRFWSELLPQLGDLYHVPVEPIYREEDRCWHVPEADMKMLFGMIEGEHRGLE